MSDELIIVKAARNYADDIDNDLGIEMGLPDCLREAANLIERLTAQVEGFQDEIKRLREQVRFASETDPAMRAEAAEAERDRLKAALAPFAAIKADDGDDFSAYDDQVVIRCEVTVGDLRKARKALGGDAS